MKKLPEDQQVDFLRTIVNCNIRAIVERDEKVRIDLGWREPRHAVFTIYVAHTDVGLVLGNEGATIDALRRIVWTACKKTDLKVDLNVLTNGSSH